VLPWHSPKIKQGLPATTNVPEHLVFSGFFYILFIPFVSIKRFTFPRKTQYLRNDFLLRIYLKSPFESYYVEGGFCHQIHMTAARLW
jgi:hypothetical protein